MSGQKHLDGDSLNTECSRRRFVQSVVAFGAAGGVAALSGCAPLEPTRMPASISPDVGAAPMEEIAADRATVAFVKTFDRPAGTRRAMALLEPVAWAGKRVFVKPNFNSADPAPGSTHLDILHTVATELHDAQVSEIVIADRSGMGETRRVFQQLGVDRMAEELGCELIAFDELDADEWEKIDIDSSHWQRGFAVPRLLREADAVVQLCCLKTHRYGGHFTLSLKNSVGLAAKYVPGDGYNYMNELHSSPHQRRMIAEINAAYTPDLVIMDGVEAFVRGGPANGERLAANVVLAGIDRVALDAVGVALLRHFGTTNEVSQGPIFDQEQIARAVELGLGIAGPDEIELVTDDAESEAYASEIMAILRQG